MVLAWARLGCHQQRPTVPLDALYAPQFNLEVPEVEPAATAALERWRREAGLPLVLEVRPGGGWAPKQAGAPALGLPPLPPPPSAARCPPMVPSLPLPCCCRSSCSHGVLTQPQQLARSRIEVCV